MECCQFRQPIGAGGIPATDVNILTLRWNHSFSRCEKEIKESNLSILSLIRQIDTDFKRKVDSMGKITT